MTHVPRMLSWNGETHWEHSYTTRESVSPGEWREKQSDNQHLTHRLGVIIVIVISGAADIMAHLVCF